MQGLLKSNCTIWPLTGKLFPSPVFCDELETHETSIILRYRPNRIAKVSIFSLTARKHVHFTTCGEMSRHSGATICSPNEKFSSVHDNEHLLKKEREREDNGWQIDLYKKCLLFSDKVCKRPWNFERVPNAMIQGHDKALIFTSTKEACLAACLNEVRTQHQSCCC